ncbi:MAG: polysulfide reductase NrfD [Vulcanimicrobiaceae bacterium]
MNYGALSHDGTTPMSYYGRPVIKEPTWRWYIGAYLFVGGLAGASAPLALAARLQKNDALARTALGAAFTGVAISPILLIADLGDRKRFINMLRVFKVTSPMSVGSWILTVFGTATGVAALGEFTGIAKPFGRVAEVAAAVTGPALATYTAALLADTAIPAWHDAFAELPFVFAGGAVASAASCALVTTPVADAALARRLVLLGTIVEFAMLERMKRELGPLVAEPYSSGRAGLFKNAARAATLASIALLRSARTSRTAARVSGALGMVAACCERFSIFEAGKASARDPKYTVEPQRARRAMRERAAT